MRHEQARYYFNDSGKFVDCYTVVYRGIKLTPFITTFPYATMSENPTNPQGVWQHGTQQAFPVDGFGKRAIDYKHLGKRIAWRQLPPDVQRALIDEARAALVAEVKEATA